MHKATISNSPVTDPLSVQDQVCFALVVAARGVVSLYRPILEPLGLTHPQYLVMLALWERAPRSLRELSALIELDAGTLSPLIKRLETAGLVSRGRDATDERLLAVRLTQEGVALRARALTVPAAVVDRLGMDPDELTQVRAGLHRVIAAIGGLSDA